jgi:hypothetical protein
MPKPKQPMMWTIEKIAAKQKVLGEVEAIDEQEALKKAAEEFKTPAYRLIARPRWW